MTLISDTTPLWTQPPRPGVAPTLLVGRGLAGRGSVAALRHRPVVATGSLLDRATINGDRLVSARDVDDRAWWIPANAVWTDAEETADPQRPRPVGLATARTRDAAILSGISDRLGWEALLAYEAGRDLPLIDGLLDRGAGDLVVLDGRLDHDIPTVVIFGRDMARWGAGATWANALHRALYGDDGRIGDEAEVATITGMLDRLGLRIVTVDLATPLITRAGVVRYSVQLLDANNDPGR